ncbi:Phage tail-collar fibre protein [Pseudomonas sp. NFACC23-1]|uniref:phage tail protein n=1 Tax=unclassified Pseudomonas TaxID=196821 RepID=UPI00087FAA93|nr:MULTISPECIES: phage tail protein [unclassified Pseudomonas]SDB36042.1 Phage tail-collar fibre protein [Pseudomonas sp. NFACC17-2]SEJ51770.1 Phage tail-collar fibre protein [Pseudomonas sp. NFACC23-1]SFW61305.1 Phage tail-collar fibre protein [Pseudomonas sp. NFACC16-2]
MADYYTLLTDAGIAYETACKAAGTPIKLSQISVGDGGGEVYNPAATATALKREVWRGPLNALFQDEKNPSWLLAEVTIPPEVGGWYVREAGIWTDTGILYAIVKYPESFKPVLATSGSGKEFYIRAIFETSNAELVTLLIDDTVVKATRAWVASYVADELAKLDRKQSVRVATTGNIVLSGAQAIDGIAVIAGNRVLVKSQTLAKDNGIYVAANDAWVRAKDADASAEVTSGLIVSVEEGATLANTIWQLVTDGAIVLGATGLVFQNITQGFAPLNSPALLGVPTAPTAPVSTNNQQLATTAFVQRALGNHSSVGGLDASTVLTADAFGRSFIINSANPVNITLPKASTGFNGGTITFTNVSTGPATIVLQGTDYVAGMMPGQLALKTMDTITLSTGAGITWYAEGGSIRDVLSTSFKELMAGKISFGQLGLGGIGAPILETFKAITPGGLYLAYGALVPNLATPDAPPDSSGNVLGVLAITPRSDCTYYFAFENAILGNQRRFWVGQYNLPSGGLFWSCLLTNDNLPFRGKMHYRTAGVYQWTVPAGVTKAYVEVVGGGGSGAFGGDGSTTIGAGGGGGGGISNRLCTVVPGSVISVTVGAGGAAVTVEGDPGIAGGTSSFGSFCSATGGRGGVMNNGAQSGVGAGGDFNASLGLGFPPVRNSAGTGNWGGPGGGGESAFAALDTSILTRPGMGGGGRSKTRSQAGADGCVFITY